MNLAWLRRPSPNLVCFVVGAGLFLANEAFHPRSAREQADARTIDVSAELADGIASDHQRRNGGAVDPALRERLIERFVEEEILYREALHLGLDRGDPIIRRRLVQKMDFVLEDAARARLTREATAAGSAAKPDAGTASFRQILFASDRRRDPEADAQNALAAIQAGEPPPSSDPFVLGVTLKHAAWPKVRKLFGDEVADELAAAEIGTWVGPVASPYGQHLLLVEERSEDTASSRSATSSRQRMLDLKHELFEKVRAGYHVTGIEPAAGEPLAVR